MIIFILFVSIAITAFGVLLIVKVKTDISNEVRQKGDDTESSEEVGTTLAAMGIVLMLASIVKLTGGISTFAYVFVLILDIACIVALLFLINKKRQA
ncbi:MAG: hypothetical protein LIO41_02795 [Ruminococcus sp.]|nr:hypothetical protein [Ruminococcus sp.]MCD7727964.1 hypothetical protein [Ruminococcus sp.]